MKMRIVILASLIAAVAALQGCSSRAGGTWFPGDSTSLREQTYWDRRLQPSHLIHDGMNPIADEDLGSVSKERRK